MQMSLVKVSIKLCPISAYNGIFLDMIQICVIVFMVWYVLPFELLANLWMGIFFLIFMDVVTDNLQLYSLVHHRMQI